MARRDREPTPLLFLALVLLASTPFYVFIDVSLLPRNVGFFPASALMVWVPCLVAIGLTIRQSGIAGVRALARRASDARRGRLGWLLLAFAIMPVVMSLAYRLAEATGPRLPPGTQIWDAPLENLVLFTLLLLPFALAEELGWSAYATGPLSSRWGALPAAIVLGVVWAAWHIVPYYGLGRSTEWVAWQCLYSVLLRVFLVWLFNASGSVFVAAVCHAMSNVSFRTFPGDGALYDPRAATLVMLGLVGLVIALHGPNLAAGRPARA